MKKSKGGKNWGELQSNSQSSDSFSFFADFDSLPPPRPYTRKKKIKFALVGAGLPLRAALSFDT